VAAGGGRGAATAGRAAGQREEHTTAHARSSMGSTEKEKKKNEIWLASLSCL